MFVNLKKPKSEDEHNANQTLVVSFMLRLIVCLSIGKSISLSVCLAASGSARWTNVNVIFVDIFAKVHILYEYKERFVFFFLCFVLRVQKTDRQTDKQTQ